MQNNQTVMMLGGRMSSSLLLRLMASSTLVPVDLLSKFGVNDVEAALALSFTTNEYRTGNSNTTFADAFMGNSPKLTYNPGSASSSQSTMVNSAGHLVWAPHSLVSQSADFSDAEWANTHLTVTASAAAAPNGEASAASKLVETSGTVNPFTSDAALSVVEAGVYTLAVYAKADGRSWIRISAGNSPFGGGAYLTDRSVYFDLENGVVGTVGSSFDSGAIEDVGGGWYKCSCVGTATTTTTLNFDIGLASADVTGSYTGDGTSGIYIWGAHLYRSDLGGMAPVPGAATGFETYVPTNGNAEYLPRVGHHVHNGSTWVNEGLLIESEARTNLFDYSNDFNGNWSKNSSPTITENASTGPDGTLSMSRITASGVASSGVYEFVSNPTGVASYTFSVFIRAVSNAGNIRLRLEGSSLTDTGIAYDAVNGAFLSNIGAAPDAYAIEDFGDDIYRVSITATTTGAGSLAAVIYDNSTTGAVFDIYGAQLEQGSTPSSYIPTNNSTVTRGGQSLVVPANWYDADNPTYTGPELVDNGGFDTDISDWVDTSTGASTLVWNNGTAELFKASGETAAFYQLLTLTAGETYHLTWEDTGTGGNVRVGTSVNAQNVVAITSDKSITFTAPAANNYLQFNCGTNNATAIIDNISVRQVSAPQFGWPEPEYIGPELVENSGFDADTDWTKGTGWTINTTTGEAVHDEATGAGIMYQDVTVEAGKVYSVVWDIASEPVSGGGSTNTSIQVFDGPETTLLWGVANINIGSLYTLFNGSLRYEAVVVPSLTTLRLRSYSDDDFSIDNISVREINPLSVSIQMDGRMTYADEDTSMPTDGDGAEVDFVRWKVDATNFISSHLVTNSTRTGEMGFVQRQLASGLEISREGDPGSYSPGVLVPFNISSRHGSTFVNGAVDGVALTADTTPTALPDLSNTNLEIAPDFMGTVGTFRQFAGDIGDTGLVTATNPSTEPTLSLTFDGTDGSFYNLNWSE